MDPHRTGNAFPDRGTPGDSRVLSAIQKRTPNMAGGGVTHVPGGMILTPENKRRTSDIHPFKVSWRGTSIHVRKGHKVSLRLCPDGMRSTPIEAQWDDETSEDNAGAIWDGEQFDPDVNYAVILVDTTADARVKIVPEDDPEAEEIPTCTREIILATFRLKMADGKKVLDTINQLWRSDVSVTWKDIGSTCCPDDDRDSSDDPSDDSDSDSDDSDSIDSNSDSDSDSSDDSSEDSSDSEDSSCDCPAAEITNFYHVGVGDLAGYNDGTMDKCFPDNGLHDVLLNADIQIGPTICPDEFGEVPLLLEGVLQVFRVSSTFPFENIGGPIPFVNADQNRFNVSRRFPNFKNWRPTIKRPPCHVLQIVLTLYFTQGTGDFRKLYCRYSSDRLSLPGVDVGDFSCSACPEGD